MNRSGGTLEVPRYLRIARALALVSTVGAAGGCASVVVPLADGQTVTDARPNDARSDVAANDAGCPTTPPVEGSACSPGCTHGTVNSCDWCECVSMNGSHLWRCYLCGGPCPPPELASPESSAIG